MKIEEAITLVEELLKREYLTKVQEIVLRQSWIGKTYLDIAVEYDYGLGYIKDVGSELWRSLSQVLEEKVTKNNIKRVLTQTAQRQKDEKQNIKVTKILAELTFEKDVIIIHFSGEYLVQESIIYQIFLKKM